NVQQTQQSLQQRAQKLLESEKSEALPKAGKDALEQAAGQMTESASELGGYQSSNSLHKQKSVLQSLEDAIASLRKSSPPPPTGSQQQQEASTEAGRDRSLRDAVVEAMKEDAPEGFGDPVKRYYEELLQ
ncbi:MAG: hypothetical protein ACPG4T_13330, partial [Nannocystaceae bacterium]